MELLKEFNLIHQRLNLSLQLQTGQRGIIHILYYMNNAFNTVGFNLLVGFTSE